MTNDALIKRIRERLEATGKTARQASIDAGGSADLIRSLTRQGGTNWPRGDTLKRLAIALETSEAWLLTGRHDGTKPKDDTPSKRPIPEIDVRAGAGGGGFDYPEADTLGNGMSVSTDAIASEWEMPESFLRGELRIAPSNAVIVEVQGDSGYDPAYPGAPGSLYPGDRVIVDRSDTRPSPPGPFLVFDGTGLVVKLVEVVQGSDPISIALGSRNPRYSTYTVTIDEAHIIGRVRGRICAM